MMLNFQPAEKSEFVAKTIRVHSIFATLQGEGPHAGWPAVFVRLAGCNLACKLCDTDYTSTSNTMKIADAVDCVEKAARRISRNRKPIVIITGGEPFRQASVVPFSTELVEAGFRVQIETNGTLFLAGLLDCVEVVCSPKTPKLDAKMMSRVNAFKYVVRAGAICSSDGLPEISVGTQYGAPARPLENSEALIYIQPLDEHDAKLNAENQKAAVKVCLKFGYVLCLQIHKIVELP